MPVAVVAAAAVSAGLWLSAQSRPTSQTIRQPAVAGQFYPAAADALKQAIQAYLDTAVPPRPERPLALVLPHAGYIYSGQIAADGYRQAAQHKYDVIVLLGTAHSSAGYGRISVYSGAGWRTPLGVAEIDRNVADALLKEDPAVAADQVAHAQEHSIEVHVPFIQHVFPGVRIVPVLVGSQDQGVCTRFGRALAKALAGRQPLIVASSDLSHYPSVHDAATVDRRTLEAIASLNPDTFQRAMESEMRRGVAELATTACGSAPIMAAMAAATALGATRATVLSYANSADVAVGDPARVVGYGAVAFTTGERGADLAAIRPLPPPASADEGPLDAVDKQALLVLARDTLQRFLTTETLPLVRGFSRRAQRIQGAFVTLNKRGELRGCIGQIVSTTPLARLVSMMALEAALNDPRFDKVKASELGTIEIEISVLTPPKRVPNPSAIVIGRDGVVLNKDGRSAVFLPQVAPQQGWNRDEMLDHLCEKGGLLPGCWRKGATLATFQADVFAEHEFARPRR